MWFAVALIVVAALAMVILAPQPKIPSPKAADSVDVPKTKEGEKFPVLFGCPRVKTIHVMWFGHLKIIAVKKKGGKK